MSYFFLDFLIDNDVYASEYTAVDPNDWLRRKDSGKKLELPINILLPDSNKNLVESLENSQCLTVLREDLVSVIQELEENVQCIKVNLKQKSEHDYYYVHTLNNVDGLDKEKSDVVALVEGVPVYSEIKKFTLLPEAVSGRHFFRIVQAKFLLIVSEELKTRLEASIDLDYTKFTPCQDYHWELSPDPVKQINAIRKT